MNRIDRITAILILLQTKRVIKSYEIAERFDVSIRTIYRDIRTLEEAGIPVGSEAGLGYFLCEGYSLPPVMFTKEEASSLLTAEKLVEKFTDTSVNKYFKSALDKIKAILSNKDKDFMESLDSQIEILYTDPAHREDFPNNFLTDIQQTLANKKVIVIDYLALYNDKISKNRTVEPIGLCYYAYAWHLIAFCRLRKDYRDFRLDRIMNLHVTDERYDIINKKSLKQYWDELSRTTELQEIIIRFDKSIKSYLERPKYFYGFVDEKDKRSQVEMYFLINDLDYIGRWLLMHGDKAEIVKPDKLKTVMKKLVKTLKEKYL
jgi:predicted DNA-binding transcriptional regulator YafY